MPLSLGAGTAARAFVVWFAVVPMLGAYWAPALGHGLAAGRRREAVQPVPGAGVDATAAWSSTGMTVRMASWLRQGTTAMPALAAVALAGVLGGGTGLLVLTAVMVVAVARTAVPSATASAGGLLRSGLEVFVPAAAAWLALGGAVQPPAALAAAEGLLWASGRWLVDNGPVLLVFAAFTLAHHGATNAVDRRRLDRRWSEIVLGYATVVAVLATGGHAAAAAGVALLLIAQWPFQAGMRSGRVLWHLKVAQWPAMAAMALASIAV